MCANPRKISVWDTYLDGLSQWGLHGYHLQKEVELCESLVGRPSPIRPPFPPNSNEHMYKLVIFTRQT